MTLRETLTEIRRSPVSWLLGTIVSVVSFGHLTGAELWALVVNQAGTWFPALGIVASTIVPNVKTVLAGDAPAHIMVLVGGASLYALILLDRLARKIGDKWNT